MTLRPQVDRDCNCRSALATERSRTHAGADPPGKNLDPRTPGSRPGPAIGPAAAAAVLASSLSAPYSKPSEPGTAGLGSRPPGVLRQKPDGAGGRPPNFARIFFEIARSDDQHLKGTDDT